MLSLVKRSLVALLTVSSVIFTIITLSQVELLNKRSTLLAQIQYQAITIAEADSPSASSRLSLMDIAIKGFQDAPVVLIEFSDFQCPFCVKVLPVIKELLARYPYQLHFIFKHLPLPSHPDAPLAHEAALAAGAQGKFWEMHDLLFANQTQLKRENLLQYAEQLGLDMQTFVTALDNHTYRAVVEKDISEARGLGVTATPTFFVNGTKLSGAKSLSEFQVIIDEQLGRKKTVATTAPVTVEVGNAPRQGPDKAPVTIVEFSDFQCPHCGRASPTLTQVLAQYPTQVTWVFKHYPLAFHPDAPLAHEASLAAQEQGKFWDMHDLLFANQRALKREDLIRYATQLGLDLNRFVEALDSRKHQAAVERDKAEGDRLGVKGTPTFFINGHKVVGAKPLATFADLIDKAIAAAGEAPLIDPAPRARINQEVTPPDARAPAPSPPPAPVSQTGEATRGPQDAPITIVEFSDFQCPFCARVSPVLQQLLGQYPTQIRWVFKHHPLAFHPDAQLAHEAALAAGTQGKFWEMHDLLFANQRALKQANLMQYAQQLGLDVQHFREELDGRIYRAIVERDQAEGARAGVTGTPTFLVNDHKLIGAQPLAAFVHVIDKELSRLQSQTAPAVEGTSGSISATGPQDAPVTLAVFADFQSPLSAQGASNLQSILTRYAGRVRLVFKHFPLPFHPQAMLAHEASLAAGAQGKFWEMHDLLFQHQQDVHLEQLVAHAQHLGLDVARFQQALETHEFRALVQQDLQDGRQRQVRGVPTLFVNRKRLDGVPSIVTLQAMIDEELAQPSPPKETRAGVSPSRAATHESKP